MATYNRCLGAALASFPFEGKITSLEPFGAGHINDTYAVYVAGRPAPRIAYVLQRLNTNVFHQPHKVMENIQGVTEFLHGKLEKNGKDPARSALHFLRTVENGLFYTDDEGMPWRAYHFIADSFCYQECPTGDIFYQSARAFGEFLSLLSDYPAETLHETIPGFHDTVARFAAFAEALHADKLGRAEGCRREVEFALAREKDCGLLVNLQQSGRLPLRVTHNDTKLNNVLFDKESGGAICVIDLDTIMPGLALNDFGDSIRFGASTAREDEPDVSKVHFSLSLFEVYTRGYLETAGNCLTEQEIELLPEGARLMTLECGMRFLTDYLDGDNYFKVEHDLHNLHRCRTQFRLVEEMEACMPQMRHIVQQYRQR